jgi:hypothetical protein
MKIILIRLLRMCLLLLRWESDIRVAASFGHIIHRFVRPHDCPALADGDGDGPPDDSAHAPTLQAQAAKHPRFLHKNFTQIRQEQGKISVLVHLPGVE